MKAKAIIQARMGSTRLPGKVLLKVKGKTMLEYLIERLKSARNIEEIIVATTTERQDVPIVGLLQKLNIRTFCGSEDDVLDRYYRASREYGADHIVRITADCPLMDPDVVDKVVEEYFKSDADYCSNVLERTYPIGEDVEVFKYSALECTRENAQLAYEREHVTPYMKKHPELFKLKNVKNSRDLSMKNWTLDSIEDFKFIQAVLEALYPSNPAFHMRDILELLERRPKLEELNEQCV